MASVLAGYLEDRKAAISIRTKLASQKNLNRHLGWIEIRALRANHGTIYAEKRRAEGVQDGTIRREIQDLRSALNWARDEPIVPRIPLVKMPPSVPPRDRWLTRDEAALLMASAKRFHVRLFIAIALYTAARHSAILELKWEQVDMDRRMVDFNPASGRRPGKRRAKVPIGNTLYNELRAAESLAETEWVIEWARAPLKRIEKGFNAARKAAGLHDVTPHTLRHTAASWLAMEGVPMSKIALYLGHASVATTERVYAHFAPDYLKDLADVLD